MGGEESGRSALDRQRGGIAVLDSDGNVTWTDDRWAAEDGDESLPRVPIGMSLLRRYREDPDSRTQAIANAIEAIFEGKATYFELEPEHFSHIRRGTSWGRCRSGPDPKNRWRARIDKPRSTARRQGYRRRVRWQRSRPANPERARGA
jgi:hypothetical protein